MGENPKSQSVPGAFQRFPVTFGAFRDFPGDPGTKNQPLPAMSPSGVPGSWRKGLYKVRDFSSAIILGTVWSGINQTSTSKVILLVLSFF